MNTRGEDGYALIELLASLVLFCMIAVLIVEGIGTGRRVWERADAAETAGSSISGAQAVLRSRLEHVFPATLYGGSTSVDFDGEQNTLTFLAPRADSAGPGALRRYTLSLTPSGDLVLSSISDIAADRNTAPDRVVLIHDVESLSFAYFGVAPPDNTAQWRFRWQQRAQTPQLIRVRVSFAGGDRRWWPDLLVKPFATIDSLCLLDAQTGSCRGRT
jgi:type II secretory pathway pseudopilin PulG